MGAGGNDPLPEHKCRAQCAKDKGDGEDEKAEADLALPKDVLHACEGAENPDDQEGYAKDGEGGKTGFVADAGQGRALPQQGFAGLEMVLPRDHGVILLGGIGCVLARNECTPYGGWYHGRGAVRAGLGWRRVRACCAPMVGVVSAAVRNECTPYGIWGVRGQLPIQTKTPTKANSRISTTVATMPPMRASDMGFLGGFSGGRGLVMGVDPLGFGDGTRTLSYSSWPIPLTATWHNDTLGLT